MQLLDNIINGMRLEDQPIDRIDSRARKAWSINGLITSTILIVASSAFWFMMRAEIPSSYDYVAWIPLIISIIWLPLGVLVLPSLKMRYWRYEIRDDEIDIQHGIFIIKRVLIPMVRVQHVDTEHGPILRHFGLATLKVSTAASNFSIPALSRERADELRGAISALANVSDEDV